MHINGLSDEVLLEIFSSLPFLDKIRLSLVCKRWYELSKSYNLFVSQKSLGCFPLPAVLEYDAYRCKNHIIKPEECVFYSLFHVNRRKKVVHSSKDVIELPQRLIAYSSIFEKCLKLSGRNLKVLGLNFCYLINESIIRLIATYCSNIEHLDLSFSSSLPFIEKTRRSNDTSEFVSNDCWLQFSKSVQNTLKHLNVICYSGITDEALMVIFENCNKLQDISISCSIYGNLKGYSLSKTPKSVNRVTIFVHYDDRSTNVNIAELAFQNLAKSEAKESLRSLRVLQSLRKDTVNQIVSNFPHLEYLHIGDNVFWVSDFHFKRVTSLIAKMKHLTFLSLKVPESFRFDPGFKNILNGCTNLKSLHIYGGRVCDDNISLLPTCLSNLESLILSYSSQEPRITDKAFESILQLLSLRELGLNGVAITDSGVEQFCKSFLVDANRIEFLDFRYCVKLTCKTMNTLIEFSKRREGLKTLPLLLLVDHFVESNPQTSIPSTIKLMHTPFSNELGLRNEYFAPTINSELIGEKFISFGKYALQDIAEKYLSDFFK